MVDTRHIGGSDLRVVRVSQRSLFGLVVAAAAAATSMAIAACGARTGLDFVAAPDAGPCGSPGPLSAQVHTCDGGGSTTISGTIYDPAAKNPLFNVVAYVPGSTPQPFKEGASCDSCSDLYTGSPVATAVTDANGRFTIKNAPDGADIPLVVQVGKWRRQFTIKSVTACEDNLLPDRGLTLPKNHAEGDIPNIAVSTGAADTLECLLSRIGLDATEYGGGADGPGHIHVFQGGTGAQPPAPPTQTAALCPAGAGGSKHLVPNTAPPGPASSQALWDSTADIMRYDMVLMSCEGDETAGMNQQVLFDYAAAGGRVFASHYHYSWFDTGPFGDANLAVWTRGANPIYPLTCNATGTSEATIVTTLANGQPFPGGQAMEQWLTNVNAWTDAGVPVENARENAIVGPANTASQAWVAAGPDSQFAAGDAAVVGGGETLYLSFNTPLNAAPANQCGQVIFSDLHVSAAAGDDWQKPVPDECAQVDLSPQEKVLEFMLFDLSSCVTPKALPPQAPPVCPHL